MNFIAGTLCKLISAHLSEMQVHDYWGCELIWKMLARGKGIKFHSLYQK